MANFCTSCGAPVIGQFCTRCGAAIQAQEQSPTAPAAPEARKGSGAKILLILLGGFLLFFAVGVAGVVYVGYRAKQKITELKKDYGIENAGSSGAASTNSTARVFPPSQGSGCKMLEGQEAASILGAAVERVEFQPNGPDGTLSCQYWVSPEERQQLMKQEIASSFASMSKSDTQSDTQSITKTDRMAFENLVGGAAGALAEANGDNKNTAYAFSLQVWQKNGKQQWDKMELAQTKAKAAMGPDMAAVAMQSVDGIGDRAIELAAGHSIMVLKGDTFFLLGFQQFVPGREKTAALARIVAGRI